MKYQINAMACTPSIFRGFKNLREVFAGGSGIVVLVGGGGNFVDGGRGHVILK